MIRLVEMRQKFTMRIGPPSPHKYRLYTWFVTQVRLECLPHRERVTGEIEMIPGHTQVDKGIDFGKGVRGHYVDCVEEELWGAFMAT